MPAARFFNHWMRSLIIVILAVSVPAPVVVRADGGLTPQDAQTMETNLLILAQRNDIDAREACRVVLTRPAYTAADWTAFFNSYFGRHPYTLPLWEYLTTPLFWGYGNEQMLEEAFIPVMEGLIDRITQANGANLSQAFVRDAALRVTFLNAHRTMLYIARYGKVDAAVREAAFNYYLEYVGTWPQYWRKSATIDVARQPYIAALAAQVQAVMREFVPAAAESKQQLADALGLSGVYQEIWQSFNVLVYDNNGLDAAQRAAIQNYLALTPPSLVIVRGIMVEDFLGNQEGTNLPIIIPGVAIFADRIGTRPFYPFPYGGANPQCDLFSLVLFHEVNHTIFAGIIEPDPLLNQRHKQLIADAGTDAWNYLNSNIENGFFFHNPQEFFAGVSNLYFCSAADTFRLGIDRFLNGRKDPINQALFFADIYSLGTNETWLYHSDVNGNLTRTASALTRDAQGRITSIALPEGTYQFALDIAGRVTQISMTGAALEITPPVGVLSTLERQQSAVLPLMLKNIGDHLLKYRLAKQLPDPLCGGALSLDGLSAEVVANTSSLSTTHQITLEAWVYPASEMLRSGKAGTIIQKGYPQNEYSLVLNSSGLVFSLAGVGTLTDATGLPGASQWTHVAAVYDGARMVIYLNGEKRAEKPASGSIITTSSFLYIGEDVFDKNGWVGYLDEVRMWTVARAQAQIAQGMRAAVPGSTPGLSAYYRYNSLDYMGMFDESSYGNHGGNHYMAIPSLPDGPFCAAFRLPEGAVELAPGQSQVLNVELASGLAGAGRHELTLSMVTTDAANPLIQYPLALDVIEQNRYYLPVIRR